MKKIIALVLVLCMTAFACSAFAEESSGLGSLLSGLMGEESGEGGEGLEGLLGGLLGGEGEEGGEGGLGSLLGGLLSGGEGGEGLGGKLSSLLESLGGEGGLKDKLEGLLAGLTGEGGALSGLLSSLGGEGGLGGLLGGLLGGGEGGQGLGGLLSGLLGGEGEEASRSAEGAEGTESGEEVLDEEKLEALLNAMSEEAETVGQDAAAAESVEQFYGTWTLSGISVGGQKMTLEEMKAMGMEEMTASIVIDEKGLRDPEAAAEEAGDVNMALVDGKLQVTEGEMVTNVFLTAEGELGVDLVVFVMYFVRAE